MQELIIIQIGMFILYVVLMHLSSKDHKKNVKRIFTLWQESDDCMYEHMYSEVNNALRVGLEEGKRLSLIDYKRGKQVGYGNAMIDNIKNPKPVRLLKVNDNTQSVAVKKKNVNVIGTIANGKTLILKVKSKHEIQNQQSKDRNIKQF